MEIIKKNWLVILILVCIGLYFIFKTDYEPEYQQKIAKIESEKTELKKEINSNISEIKKIRQEKQQILESLKRELDYKDIILSDSRGATQVKEKVKIIPKQTPKQKSLNVVEISAFNLSLRDKFAEYVRFDIQEQRKVDDNLKKCLELNTKSENVIEIQKKVIKRLRRRWNVSVGLGFVIGFNGDVSYGLVVSFGYRIL